MEEKRTEQTEFGERRLKYGWGRVELERGPEGRRQLLKKREKYNERKAEVSFVEEGSRDAGSGKGSCGVLKKPLQLFHMRVESRKRNTRLGLDSL